jgi:hypothetical protein
MRVTITDYLDKETCESTGKVTECVRIESQEEQIADAVVSFPALISMIRFRVKQELKCGGGKESVAPEKSRQ